MAKTLGFLLILLACPAMFAQTLLTDTLAGSSTTNLSAHTADTGNTWTAMNGGNLLLDGNGYVYATGTAQDAHYKASGTTFSIGSTLIYTCSFNVLTNANYAGIGVADAAGNIYQLTSLSSTYATGSGFQIEKMSNDWVTSSGTAGSTKPLVRSLPLTPSGVYTATFIVTTDGTTVTMNATVAQAGTPVWSSGNVVDTSYPTVNQAVVRGYATTTGTVTTGHHVGNLSVAHIGGVAASPNNILAGSSSNTIHLTGGGGSWVSGTTVFSVSAGTVTSQTVTSSTAATIIYTAPAGDAAVIVSDSTDSATGMFYTYVPLTTSGGSVGIGTTTPLGQLDIEALNLNQYGHLIVNRSNSGGLGGEVTIRNAAGGTGAAGALAFELDGTTAFDVDGNDVANAEIRAINRNGATKATDLQFTNFNGTSEQTDLTIQGSSGNVGIGTTSPGARLEVNGVVKLSSGSGGTVTFPDGSIQTTAYIPGSGGPVDIHDTGGNIGIGTTSPAYPLTVAGAAAIGDTTAGAGDASNIPLLNKFLGTTTDSALNYILLSYTNTTTGGFSTSGFDGQLYLYRGSSGAWNAATEYDVATKDAYNGYSVMRFNSYGSLSAANVVTLSYSGHSYVAVQIPSSSSMDVYVTGRSWGFAPSVVAASAVSSVTQLETAYVTQDPSGNIGLGTATPGAKLDVSGNVKISGSGASLTFPDSTVQATAWTGTLTGGDYAESVDVSGERDAYAPGDVLVLDPQHPGRVIKAAEPYSLAVAGVYSTKPGLVGRRQKIDKKLATTEVPMAMVGIVPTKVSAENGAIHPGDILVSSSTTGYAMKGTDRSLLAGAVVGKAMGSLDSGKGVIEVLISLQ